MQHKTSKWLLLALPCLLAFRYWNKHCTYWEAHIDIKKKKSNMLSRFYDSGSHKVSCWYAFAGVWKMKRRLLLNLIFSRKVLSVCPGYYMGMLCAMVINKSISSENLVLVFQLTCWQTLVNAIAQISSCCNPWKCYNRFYKTKLKKQHPTEFILLTHEWDLMYAELSVSSIIFLSNKTPKCIWYNHSFIS